MPNQSLSGSDTINIGGVVLQNLADGDVGDLTFPNEIVKVKTGKNGNAIFAVDASGIQVDVKVRVLRGSEDDVYLNSIVSDFLADPASFTTLDGTFVKRIGDGTGIVTSDTYVLGGGVPTRQPAMKENVEGDTEQSVTLYELKFTNARRAIL